MSNLARDDATEPPTKGRITKVGTVTPAGRVDGWAFDLAGTSTAGIDICDGLTRYAGYTVNELREIAADADRRDAQQFLGDSWPGWKR